MRDSKSKSERQAVALIRLNEIPSIIDHIAPVIKQVEQGSLGALAKYIRDRDNVIEPMVAARIAALIDGTSAESGGQRLVLKRHPDVPRRGGTANEKRLRKQRDRDIAREMVLNGAIEPSGYESALEATMTKFDLKRSVVSEAWGEYAPLLRGDNLSRPACAVQEAIRILFEEASKDR